MTLEIQLNRQTLQPERTFGELLIGKHFCWTLEDTDRGLYQDMTPEEIQQFKEYGKTAIPAGRYRITLVYSPKFKRLMPYVNNVTGFSGILLHGGTTEADTLGCPLIAYNKDEKAGKVWKSAEKDFTAIIADAEARGVECYITVN